MSLIDTQATPATIGKKRAETPAQRKALAQYGAADIEGVLQFCETISVGGEAKKGGVTYPVTAARARAYFKVGAK